MIYFGKNGLLRYVIRIVTLLEEITSCYGSPTHIASTQSITTGIQFLQGQLPVIPGTTRNIKIDGQKFENLLVYSTGEGVGGSLMNVLNEYKSLQSNPTERVGLQNFFVLGKTLCTKGEMKTGLSSYFMNIRGL